MQLTLGYHIADGPYQCLDLVLSQETWYVITYAPNQVWSRREEHFFEETKMHETTNK